MRPGTLRIISATAVCALLTVVIECVAVPQPARIIPGVLMVFFLPGFATVRAVHSANDMSGGERLLASLAVSVVITVCASALLGATVGLSQKSVAVALAGVTLVACSFALVRIRGGWHRVEDLHEWHASTSRPMVRGRIDAAEPGSAVGRGN